MKKSILLAMVFLMSCQPAFAMGYIKKIVPGMSVTDRTQKCFEETWTVPVCPGHGNMNAAEIAENVACIKRHRQDRCCDVYQPGKTYDFNQGKCI